MNRLGIKFLLVLFLTCYGLVIAQQKDSIALRYSALIKASEMKKNLTVLASDEYEGRETGQKGQKMAADYIAKQFKSYKIPTYNGKNYFQKYPLNLVKPAQAEININQNKKKALDDYFNFAGISKQIINEKEFVFVGYAISESNYDELKNIDLKDKIVMLMEGEPIADDSTSIITGTKTPSTYTTYYKSKTEKIKEQQPKAILMVMNDIEVAKQIFKHKIETPAMKIDMSKKDIPLVFISVAMANEMLNTQSIEKLKRKISFTKSPITFTQACNIEISIDNKIETTYSENVLAYIEGSDLKNELIVITAHYDHLGKEGKIVYNGADDDGSGTVAVMNLAKAFAKAKQEGFGPRRSILFMTVSGEEKGLLGSSYYTDNPVYPLQSTVCNLNIDMIGRLDEKHKDNSNYIYLIGSDRLSKELHAISENTNSTYTQIEMDYTYNDENDKNRYYYRSDHYNFAKNNVPVIFYFNGVHEDYHQETDEVSKINFEKMEKITQLVFHTAWQIANRNQRLRLNQ
jgi:Peptidase family M28